MSAATDTKGGPNHLLNATPSTAPQFRAQADLQRKIADGYVDGKTRNPELAKSALDRARHYDAKALALESATEAGKYAGAQH